MGIRGKIYSGLYWVVVVGLYTLALSQVPSAYSYDVRLDKAAAIAFEKVQEQHKINIGYYE